MDTKLGHSPLGFLEKFVKNAIIEKQSGLMFKNVPVSPSDASSSKGLLPCLLQVMHQQAKKARPVLPEKDYEILFGWLHAFKTVDDSSTLTGKRVECNGFPYETSNYLMAAGILVALDYIVECSPGPKFINFDIRGDDYGHRDEVRPI